MSPAATKLPVVAIYPGSFDPITNGHLDVIARGSKLVDKLIVAVLRNEDKQQPLFTVEVALVQGSIGGFWARAKAKLNCCGIRAIFDHDCHRLGPQEHRPTRRRPHGSSSWATPPTPNSSLCDSLTKELHALTTRVLVR